MKWKLECLRGPLHEVVYLRTPGEVAGEQTSWKPAYLRSTATISRSLRFALGSSNNEGDDVPLPCTTRQAVRLGEFVAPEVESRTMEPFVTR